jgi:hypothetical protein
MTLVIVMCVIAAILVGFIFGVVVGYDKGVTSGSNLKFFAGELVEVNDNDGRYFFAKFHSLEEVMNSEFVVLRVVLANDRKHAN